jgi:hypothetical protein
VSRQLTATDLLDTIADAVAERVACKLGDLLRESHAKPTQEASRYLSERAVAERLGISVRTLQGWRSVGRGPEFQKAGRRVLYPADGLQRFLTEDSASRALPEGANAAQATPTCKRAAVRRPAAQ